MLRDTSRSTTNFVECSARTILVVEDEEPIRMFLSEFLQDCGHSVLEAADVAQAKCILVAASVDLVFSDINMPGGETGFVLEEWVRRHYPKIKVILTSGFPQPPERTMALLEPLLPKPYSCSAVLRRIEDLLGCRVMLAETV